jgi:Chromate transporter
MKAVAPGDSESAARSAARGSFLEVLGVFLKLGLTSFGGPIAHLGYFRAEFVEHRRWLTESNFVDLVALRSFCQDRRRVRRVSASGFYAAVSWAALPLGPGSPCPQRSSWCSSPTEQGALAISPSGQGFSMGSSSSPWRSWRKPSWEWRERCARTGCGLQSRRSH